MRKKPLDKVVYESRSDIERLEFLNVSSQLKARSKPNLLKRKLDFSGACERVNTDHGKEVQEKRVIKQIAFQEPAPESKSESLSRLKVTPLHSVFPLPRPPITHRVL